jgi:hypothetical protein
MYAFLQQIDIYQLSVATAYTLHTVNNVEYLRLQTANTIGTIFSGA